MKPKLFEFHGMLLTYKQLAEFAGCSPVTMQVRITSGMSPYAAVAMRCSWSRKTKRINVMGEKLTVRKIADQSGTSVDVIRKRMRTHSPSVALAMGPPDRKRMWKSVLRRMDDQEVQATDRAKR